MIVSPLFCFLHFIALLWIVFIGMTCNYLYEKHHNFFTLVSQLTSIFNKFLQYGTSKIYIEFLPEM